MLTSQKDHERSNRLKRLNRSVAVEHKYETGRHFSVSNVTVLEFVCAYYPRVIRKALEVYSHQKNMMEMEVSIKIATLLTRYYWHYRTKYYIVCPIFYDFVGYPENQNKWYVRFSLHSDTFHENDYETNQSEVSLTVYLYRILLKFVQYWQPFVFPERKVTESSNQLCPVCFESSSTLPSVFWIFLNSAQNLIL